MSEQNTQAVKGIAIILVVAGHIMGIFFDVPSEITNYLGTGGVSLFLILSGYGLYSSYCRNGLHRDFWDKKICKVFVPYWILTFLYGIYIRSSNTILLKNLMCIDYDRNYDGTMWYLSLLLIEYIAFFVIFYFTGIDAVKIALLFIVGLVIKENTGVFRSCAWQFGHNWLSFPFGVLLGYIGSLVSGFIQKYTKIMFKLGMVITFLALYVYGLGARWSFQTQGIMLCMLLISVVSLFPLVLKRPLTVMGIVSYPIYLIEGKLFTVVGKMNAGNFMSAVSCVLIYIVLLGISTVFVWLLCEFINRRCGLSRTNIVDRLRRKP